MEAVGDVEADENMEMGENVGAVKTKKTKQSWIEKQIDKVFGTKEDEDATAPILADSQDAKAENTKDYRAQEESFEIQVDKVIVDGNIGSVHFKEKPLHYIVPGQLIVFSNFNHGGSKRDLKHLNGHWPVSAGDGKKSQKWEKCFLHYGRERKPCVFDN